MRCVTEDLGISIISNQKGSTATFSMLNAASASPADMATVARAARPAARGGTSTGTTVGGRRCAGADHASSPRGRIGSVGEGPRGADSGAGAKAGSALSIIFRGIARRRTDLRF